MFLRSVKAPNGHHEYLRLVESFRDGDKVKQRIVAHLGRKDLLAPHLDALIRLLQSDQEHSPLGCRERHLHPARLHLGADFGSPTPVRQTLTRLHSGCRPTASPAMASLCRNGSFRCWPTV